MGCYHSHETVKPAPESCKGESRSRGDEPAKLPSVMEISVHTATGLRASDLALALMFSSTRGRVQDFHDFSHSAILGKGSFAVVRLAKSLRTGEEVAVKTVKLGEPARKSMVIARRRTEEEMESCDHSCATAWRASDTGDLTSARGIRVTLSGESEIRAYMGLRGSSTALASGDSCLSASSSASPGGGAARDRGRSEDLATSRARKIAAQQPAPALPPRRSLESARRHFTDVANRRVSPLQPAAPSPHSPGSPNTSVSSPDSGHGGSTSAASAGELPGAEWTLSPEQRAAEKKSATELSMICREIDVLCRFKNEAVVNLIEYFVSPQGNHIHIVLELLKGGSLLDELKCRHPSRGCFTEAESRVVTRRLLKGIAFLHENGCVHRDLKLENILLKEPGNLDTVTIADFGFAKRLLETQNGGAAFHTLLGTPSYNAPEVLEQAALYKEPLADGSPLRGAYDSALDIWAVGVMLFKMLSGRLPFEAGSEYELYQKIRAGRINMDGIEWECVGEGAQSLVRRMLTIVPAKRPTAAALLAQDAWLNAATSHSRV